VIALGVQAIEIDLRATRDGAIVVIHDKTVDRTTDGRGRVTDLTLAELRRLDAGHGERIPTYEEVLELVAGTGLTLVLDIKRGTALDRPHVARMAARHGAGTDVIVGVRTLDDLSTFQSLDPELRLLGFMRTVEEIEPFVRAGVDIVRLWPAWIEADRELVTRIHALGKAVWATAGGAGRDELEWLVDRSVDGILSDRPDLARPLLEELGRKRGRAGDPERRRGSDQKR
jgi:glycerophosphoryl diester phosphodiesterase